MGVAEVEVLVVAGLVEWLDQEVVVLEAPVVQEVLVDLEDLAVVQVDVVALEAQGELVVLEETAVNQLLKVVHHPNPKQLSQCLLSRVSRPAMMTSTTTS